MIKKAKVSIKHFTDERKLEIVLTGDYEDLSRIYLNMTTFIRQSNIQCSKKADLELFGDEDD